LTVIDARHSASFALRLPEYLHYRNLLRHLIIRDLRLRYRNASLGFLWAVLQPFAPMIIIRAVFGSTLNVATDGVPYMLYALAGLVPWSFFSAAVSTASMSFLSNSAMMSKVYFPRGILPAAAVLGCSLDLLIGLVLLVAMCLGLGSSPRLSWTLTPLVSVFVVGLACFLSLGLASLNVLYRDVKHAVPFVLQMWMFATPVIYPPGVVSGKWVWLLGLNPMTAPVLAMRKVVFDSPMPSDLFWTSVLSGVVLSSIAVMLFLRLERQLVERI
jgi:lipopolysaccharide transport system permease protein